MNKSENKAYQNVWVVANAVLKGKCTALNVYIRKGARS